MISAKNLKWAVLHKYALHLKKIINIVSILFLFRYQMVVVRNIFFITSWIDKADPEPTLQWLKNAIIVVEF